MNIKHFISYGFACLALFVASCTSSQPSGYVINGTVDGLADGTKLILCPLSHDNDSALAETVVADGQFKFEGVAQEPICAQILVKDSYGFCSVMLENCTINVTATVSRDTTNTQFVSYSWKADVKGGELNDKLKAFDARHDSLDYYYNAYQEKYAEAFKKQNTLKGAELEAYKQSAEYREANDAEKAFFDRVESTINGMIMDNKDNFWAPLLAVKYMSYFSRDQRDMYNSFSEEAKNSYYGKKMQLELWPSLAVADKVEKFELKNDNGETYNFKKLAEGKTYILLDFWASWCMPCRKELPNVKKQYSLYKDKGFQVVSISIDSNADAWKKALADEQMEWPNFRSQEVADMFRVSAVPTAYLIDAASGKIVADGDEVRGEELQAILAKLYK